ncbi:hypothetical protein [Oceanihabitans sp. 2_MG-2023]|uniref:hypothetical protein n=1 Tax=Oceanihabitans sp. 2_MG-2023 TaxID=3062661 RepID=UPI0026E26015|nr:hypothetical protein [Oceanihabitans sp. 2_MG-2023]
MVVFTSCRETKKDDVVEEDITNEVLNSLDKEADALELEIKKVEKDLNQLEKNKNEKL